MNPCGKIIPKIKYLCHSIILMVAIFIIALTSTAQAQSATDSISFKKQKNADSVSLDSAAISLDSLSADSTQADSVTKSGLEESLGIRISADAVTAIVTSKATDSAVLDMRSNVFYLYGDAQVNYEDLQLNAGQLAYNQGDNLVTAAPSYDSAGQMMSKERPSFTQGAEKFTYDSLQYNFKSKRAIVLNARSQYGEGYVFSKQVKRNPDQSIYGLHNVYTTCALDTPHFGIIARRIKVVPGRVAATGPANIEIMQVPTPLFLPFGLFPITQGQRSGFRLPTYTLEEQRGLGLINGGYYFSVSEYVDLLVQSNIYSKGSYAIGGVSTYNNIYHYTGGLSLSYAYNKNGEIYEPNSSIEKSFLVNWSHRSDPKSRPGASFNASVNAGSSNYYRNNSYVAAQVLQNQFVSNITYSKAWQNKPYSLAVGARHSQNTQTKFVEVTLPEVSFYVAQFNPFQSKRSSGSHWYDKITTQYNFNALNKVTFYDTSFSLNQLSNDDLQYGVKHNIPVTAAYNIFRFVNVNLGVNYNEYWLTRKTYRSYNTNTEKLDTLQYRGFYTARDFNASVGANTRIYGLKMFKKGKVMGIRHVLSPAASLTYTPDYAQRPFRYGYRTIIDRNGAPQYLSVFDGSVVGTPINQFGDFSSLLGFSLDNNLQMKVRTKDSVGSKNVRLIDNLTFSGGYDLARDSFNWSNVNVRFATNVLDVINISANAVFDPYEADLSTGVRRRLKNTMIESGKGLAKFQGGDVSLQGSFHAKPKTDKSKEPGAQTDEFKRLMDVGRYNDYVDFNIPWNLNFSYSLQVTNGVSTAKRDTFILNHFVGFSGDVNLSQNWKIGISSGYNFSEKRLTYTSIDIYRDLHCWEMRLQTIPFGPQKSYNFTINVKASVLQDLKLLRRRDFRDAVY